jgi:hypothetical protein
MTTYLRITAVIFGVVVLVHALRMALGWPIVIAGWSVPQWMSAIGVVVAGALCAWALSLLLRSPTR